MAIEHKSFSCSIKAVDDDQGIIEAYGSVFGVEDAGRDIVQPGAFKRSIQNSKSRMTAGKSSQLAVMLWQHDSSLPIGSWFELTEDAHGLKCKGRMILTTQAGKDAYELVKNGVVDQLSIGYDVPHGGSNYDAKGVRNLTELRLWEVSLVTFAMNDEALVTSVKKDGHAMSHPPNAPAPKERKTFADHLAEEQCEDLLEDWQDVLISALTSAVYDAFNLGDTPETDVAAALTAFGEAVAQWVALGQQYGLSDYLEQQGWDSDGGTADAMHYGSESRPNYGGYGGYMSRRTPMQRKDQRLFQIMSRGRKAMMANDATTGGLTADHVDQLKTAATKANKKVADHAAALTDCADTVSDMVSGAGMKAGRAFSSANAAALTDHAKSLKDLAGSLQTGVTRQMKAVTTVADDLATVLQGSEAAYGTDAGTPAKNQQHGKGISYPRTHANSLPSSPADTVTEEELTAALGTLKSLRALA